MPFFAPAKSLRFASVKRIFLIAIPVLILLLALACNRRPELYVSEGILTMSTDTVSFDTIFTGMPSPTRRLQVKNQTGKNILISSIKLENGADYDMVFDGIPGDEIINYEFPDGDSALAFLPSWIPQSISSN